MKQLMPSAVMQAATASEIGAANAAKTGYKGADTGIPGGFSADSPELRSSFLDSLENLISAGGAKNGSVGNVMGGKTLPLADLTATSDLTNAFQPSVEGGLRDTALAAGLSVGSQGLQQDAAALAGSDRFTRLSELIARTPPQQALTANTETVTQLTASAGAADDTAVAMQAEAVQHKAGALTAADASIARMQRGMTEAPLQQDTAVRETVNRTGMIDPLAREEAANLQPQVAKHATLANETDQLFTSRIQMGTLNQAAELVSNKQALEALTHTTQANAADALQASAARAPMSQPVLTTESQSASVQTMITETFGKPEWNQGMGKQILWMVNQNISRAEIRLNPANLGPIEVRVDMENDQVNVAFTSRHADVREAVEQALPRLREMLEEKGLNLADTDVSHQSFAEQQQQAFEQADRSGTSALAGNAFAVESALPVEDGVIAMPVDGVSGRHGQGLVDLYI